MRKLIMVLLALLIIFASSCGETKIEQEPADVAIEVETELINKDPIVEESTDEEEVEEIVEEPETVEEIQEEEYYEEEVIEEDYIEDVEIFEEDYIYEEPIEEEIEEVYEEPAMTYYGNCQITAYEWTGNPCANGAYPTEGYTVACNNLPLGTQIYIDGVGYRTVEDRGATWHATNWIDLYLGDVSACFEWGVQYLDVWIVE